MLARSQLRSEVTSGDPQALSSLLTRAGSQTCFYTGFEKKKKITDIPSETRIWFQILATWSLSVFLHDNNQLLLSVAAVHFRPSLGLQPAGARPTCDGATCQLPACLTHLVVFPYLAQVGI